VPEAVGNRPSAEQLLLLHAALDEPQAASKSWKRWSTTVGIDNADPSSQRLLPLLYTRELHQLLGLAGREVDAVRLRGVYRDAWIRNRLLFERAAGAIGVLGAAGIETLVIKGAPLALLSYDDVGARPMDDVDVLVPLARAADAIDVLSEAGWTAESDDPMGRIGAHHSTGFAGPGGGNVDLHWFALWQPASDEPLWKASVPLEIAGGATRAPCPADQLLLVCAHGIPWSRLPSFRWIADAIVSIRGAGDGLDWDRFAAEAERRRLTVAAGAALAFLREEFEAPVPAPLLARLDAVPVARHERVAFRAAGGADSAVRTLRMAWDRYRRLRDLETGAPRPQSFVSFARSFWGLESAWQLPLHAVSAISRRRDAA
jgi:Uncharacterised nucleotidyltransferase